MARDDAVLDALAGSGLFPAWSMAELAGLLGTLERPTYAASAPVLTEGAPADAMYLVLRGRVQVFTSFDGQSEVVLATLVSLDWFGEHALLPGTPGRRTASVRALTDCELLKIGRAAFRKALTENQPLKQRLVEVDAARLRARASHQTQLFHALEADASGPAEERPFTPEEVIFEEGDAADHLYLILEGEIGIAQRTPDGSTRELAVLTTGQCFGELGLMQAGGRTATARARTAGRLLVVPGERFERLRRRSPELRDHLQTLQRVYKRSRHGLVTQHTGRFLDRECITTLYELPGGRRWVAARVVGDDIFDLTCASTGAAATSSLTYEDPDVAITRELRLSHDRSILGITAHGPWPGLHDLHDLALEGTPLTPEQLAEFEHRGAVTFERDASLAGDHDPLCRCMGVERGVVRRAIAQDCRDLSQLQARFGCGTVCGGCLPLLRDLIARPAWTFVQLTDEIRVTPTLRLLRLTPVHGSLSPFEPGQHVVVQARVGSHWIERPFALASSCRALDDLQILVERRPDGALSSWLFYLASRDSLIRVSQPRWDDDGSIGAGWTKGPVVCLVAGVGIAPALSIVRSWTPEASPVFLDYSVRHREQLVCEAELRALASQPGIEATLRVTSEHGRLAPSDLACHRDLAPQATFFVCGPAGFRRDIVAGLRDLGVEGDRVRVLSFEPPEAEPPRTSWTERLMGLFRRPR